MVGPSYRKISDLTEIESDAARAYGSESGFFHLACQADHSMALSEFNPYQEFVCSCKLAALKSATSSRYELAADATLFSGHGNGVGVVGGLGHSHPDAFVGMTWQYRGFTSTSARKDKAEDFVRTRAKSPLDTPAFLEFRLPAGFRLLPMAVLGADSTHEAEFLLTPNLAFKVVEAVRGTFGGVGGVLHLILNEA